MKKLCIIIISLILATSVAEGRPFYRGFKRDVGTGDVVLSLTEIVRLFDQHAKVVGGAGFFYGVKSKFMTISSDSHRDLLQNYILRTPGYMLRASGISEDDPSLSKTFVYYCGLMPTAYDTYAVCRNKILLCIKAVFPGKSDAFYRNIMREMRNNAGAD
ncbi:MAG: hypothetical protein HQ549_05405 [Candidatus Omnitrophica bacterium]|nr:hypothetical protein [Candidatus Omnitrophota bacterium]